MMQAYAETVRACCGCKESPAAGAPQADAAHGVACTQGAHSQPSSSDGTCSASVVYGAYVVASWYSQLKRAATCARRGRRGLRHVPASARQAHAPVGGRQHGCAKARAAQRMPAGSCGAGPHAPRPRTSLRLRRSQCPRSGPAAGKERVERGPQRACRPERDLRAKAARGCTGVETQSVGTGARLLVPEQRRVDVVRGRDQADARACGQLAEQRLRARRAQPCARRPGSRSEGATGVPSHVSTPQRRPQAATRAGARRAKHAGSPLPLKRTPPATQAGQPAAQDGARVRARRSPQCCG